VNLFQNPVFVTQKRLVHRAGVMVAILFSALVGLCFLSGLIAYMTGVSDFHFISNQDAGKVFYGWTLGLEILLLPIMGMGRISRVLNDDRKSGIWESNRLTPLKPSELVTGYWFGSPLREFYMGAVLAIVGLVIVLLAGLPITLWLGTQVLVLSTTLLFGLLGVLVGATAQQQGVGAVMIIGLVFAIPFSLSIPRLLINFLLPVNGLGSLFGFGGEPQSPFAGAPMLYGVAIPPIIFTLTLQFIVAVFLWRAVKRKVATPFQPPLLRWEALAFFGVQMIAQHGLIWDLWRANFPARAVTGAGFSGEDQMDILPMVQIASMVLGIALIAIISPLPERVRLEALRTGSGSLRLAFSRSALTPALLFAALGGLILLTQFLHSITSGSSAKIYLVAFGNLLNFFLIYALLLECCRLWFRRRAAGFVALGLFILCILPFILAGVFSNETIGHFSLLSPGALALSEPNSDDLNYLLFIDFAHLGVVVALFIGWVLAWKRLLAQATPVLPPVLTQVA